MKKILLFFLVLSLKGVAQTPTTAIAYNNHIAGYSDSLFAMGKEWGRLFNDSYKSGDYAPLKTQAILMEKYITKSLGEIEQMKDFKDSKPLRMSMINFLKFEKTLVQTAFKPFESFTANTPADTVQAAINNLTGVSKDEAAYLQKVAAAQEKYAAQNGFTIEAKKNE